MADIAFITSWLNIRAGSTVVEAGESSLTTPVSPISLLCGRRFCARDLFPLIARHTESTCTDVASPKLSADLVSYPSV
jgi:hypothetical protein